MQEYKKARLVLEDGSQWDAYSFGYEAPVSGEVVFNTAMVGYPESLTDPSYCEQILVITFPLVGNYGVPEDEVQNHLSTRMESEKIQVSGLIVSDYSFEYSHWAAVESLGDWLKRSKVPGLFGIDTRELTKVIREHGVMRGKILFEGMEEPEYKNFDDLNLVSVVSCKEVIEYKGDGPTVVLVDCGVKHNIIRCLIARGVNLIRVPWDYDFNTIPYDGLFISNGPGNPSMVTKTVEHLRVALEKGKPIFGICMGNQLLSMAAGAKTYKLKYGHRSHNQPVKDVQTNRCYITSQNHGYAVDSATLSADWTPLFVNMNDGSNEGVCHKSKPFFSAQFHPEAASGPTDTEFLFDKFINLIQQKGK